MMTREEIYGGSYIFEFAAAGEIYTIPPYTDWRVLYMAGGDLTAGTVEARLPRADSIRQEGWLVYFIVNDTNIPCDVSTALGTVLITLQQGQALEVGLVDADNPVTEGTWAIRRTNVTFGLGSVVAEIVCLGSSTGAGEKVNAYQYSADVWVSYADLPTLSGTGLDIGAVGVPTASEPFQVYYGQNNSFLEWSPFAAIARTTSNHPFRQTGLGVILGSAIGDLLHITNASTGIIRRMEAYSITGDSWAYGNDFPAFPGLSDPDVSIAESLGEDTFWEYMYFSISTPDLAAVFVGYNQITQVYFGAAYPPWPRGPYRPSLCGIADRMHWVGGSYSSASSVAYSTDTHHEYNPFLNSWTLLPAAPVVGRGMGVSALDDPLDRFFFGMGETTSVPSETNFEYNLTTRTYRARATFAWGSTREERESAWARYQPFGP